MTSIARLAAPLTVGLLLAGAASAQTSALPSGLFAFPSENPSPASAVSAGFGMADRWIGAEPFDNPATAGWNALSVSPLMQRVNRQDLRAVASDYDETAAFFDFSGAWGRFAPGHGWTLTLYANQPVFRREDSAFTMGDVGAPEPPVNLHTNTETREQRAGLGIGWRHGSWSAAVAPEWLHREDHFEFTDLSGGPSSGTTTLDLQDDQFGGQFGARYASTPGRLGGLKVGAGVRYVPQLEPTGTLVRDLATGATSADVASTRESAWEGGISAEVHLATAFRVIAGGGGRTATEWTGLDASSGQSGQFAVGGEFHDPADPWAVRFGIGRELHPGTPESSAGVVALGAGWSGGDYSLDVGVVRRSLERADSPTSYDDRVVATLTYAFKPH